MPQKGLSDLHADTAQAIIKWIVESDLPVGYHLTEQRLGTIFKLSRTPIRGALGFLDRHGVVEQRPDRGFFLSVSGWELGRRGPILPETANDEIYRVIASDWFAGEIPNHVSTAELVRRYGRDGQDVSRALKRLAEDNVVERAPGKGWRLGPNLASAEDFLDSYLFRMTIEPAAILLDTFTLDPPLSARSRRRHEAILKAGKRATIKEMVDADLEFHHLIAVSCGNRFLAQSIDGQNLLRRLTEILTPPDGQRLRESSAEHVAILDAIVAGRRDAAANLMRKHLSVSMTQNSPNYNRSEKRARR